MPPIPTIRRSRLPTSISPGARTFFTSCCGLCPDRYLDPNDRQNEAPTAWQIFRFMCLHPTLYASGYVTCIDRDDRRETLDDIAAPELTPELRTAASAFCATSDNEMDSGLKCFWD